MRPKPKNQVGAKSVARQALNSVVGFEQKLNNIVTAIQRNLNQLYTNQKAVSDMGYTNNIHVHVLKKIVQEKLEVSNEEYSELCDLENATREEIQKRQMEEERKRVKEEQDKQVATAMEKVKADNPPVESHEKVPQSNNERPVIFGGDVGGSDVESTEQSREVHDMHPMQERDGSAQVQQEG